MNWNENPKEKKVYALKRVQKTTNLMRRKSLVLGSRLLVENDCPFIMDGFFTCENDKYMYEVMDVADGGDLSTYL